MIAQPVIAAMAPTDPLAGLLRLAIEHPSVADLSDSASNRLALDLARSTSPIPGHLQRTRP
ncbi:hypothetical protein D3C71_1820010 [compost metagenome]